MKADISYLGFFVFHTISQLWCHQKIVFHCCYLATMKYCFITKENIKRFLIKKIHDNIKFLQHLVQYPLLFILKA